MNRPSFPHGIATVVRTCGYLGLGLYLYFRKDALAAPANGLMAGAIVADLVTWLILCVIELPHRYGLDLWDGLVNIAFISFLMNGGFLGQVDSMSIGAAFAGFLVVLMLKSVAALVRFSRRHLD